MSTRNTDKIGHIGSTQLLKVDRTILVPEGGWANEKERGRQRKAEKASAIAGFGEMGRGGRRKENETQTKHAAEH